MADWKTIAKSLSSVGILGVTGLLAYLFLLPGISYTSSGDSLSYLENGVWKADAYINVTPAQTIVFEKLNPNATIYYFDSRNRTIKTNVSKLGFEPVLYSKTSTASTLYVNLNKVSNIIDTQPNIKVDWLVPVSSTSKLWRPIRSGDKWTKGTINRIKLVGYPKEGQTVKWSFIVGDKVNIDPIWYAPYSYNYSIEGESLENRKGVYLTTLENNTAVSKYIDFVELGVTGSIKNNILTIKMLDRGGTWYDKDLDSCYNKGVPCAQYNLNNDCSIILSYKDEDKQITPVESELAII